MYRFLSYLILSFPFRISTVPSEYQARMARQVLDGFYVNGSVVYIDDTVIYGKNEKVFLEMLDVVLGRMAQFNVRLKPRKFSFGMTSVEFFRHIFDEWSSFKQQDSEVVQDIPILCRDIPYEDSLEW